MDRPQTGTPQWGLFAKKKSHTFFRLVMTEKATFCNGVGRLVVVNGEQIWEIVPTDPIPRIRAIALDDIFTKLYCKLLVDVVSCKRCL